MNRIAVFVLAASLVLVCGMGSAQADEYRFGWIPEKFEDQPDSVKVFKVDIAPGCPSHDSVDSIDISHQMPPIGNQSSQGS